MTCAFTGHRDLPADFDVQALEKNIEKLAENGVNEFLCGMAVGFDLLCAECVIKLKEKYGLKLVACIPCESQEKYYSYGDKLRYGKILSFCDEKKVLAPRYSSGCMLRRDRYMVGRADVVLCYLKKRTGGTYYTVNFAKASGVKIIYFDPLSEDVTK